MIWNPFRRRSPTKQANAPQVDLLAVVNLIERLLSAQLMTEYGHVREVFSILMTNKLAAGYVFGFHDAFLAAYRLAKSGDNDANLAILRGSYEVIFGDQAGHALSSSSVYFQADQGFAIGRQSGGEDALEFIQRGTPVLGLQRIICLGFTQDMVVRTLDRDPRV